MAIKKSQLYNALWESCNALRGSMDASQYKDYVLIVLFVKYLSDKAGQPGFRLRVPEGCSFKDFVALKQDDKIGEKMNVKLEAIKELNARQIGDLALPNFNDPTKLGTGRTMVDTLSRLIGVFENDALDFSHNRAADDDLLGDAYEYLMKNFAAESGKSKGQFYTPAEVSRVMAKVLRIDELDRAEQSIYDPTCGSGSLLLRALTEASNPRVSICGQEKDSSTAALAKLNILLHGISNADIKVGDTLADPQFRQYGMVSTFDVCVANPPFSMKNWLSSGMENDQYNRWTATLLPPAKCGDYAFLLHLIASMKPEEGRGACILPHGVLFRGNAEYDIRKHIVTKRYIKGIIGLPPNIFFGTSIPASIIIIDKKNKENRKGIFFIDAKDGFKKDGAMNRLREQDIKRIIDAWDAQQTIDHYCRLVKWDEIERNDYNLNIPRYIQPRDTEIQQDIYAHLHGGLPAHDVDSMDKYWEACPSLKVSLFKHNSNGYYSLKPAKTDIAHTIENDPSYINQSGQFAFLLAQWGHEVMPKMKDIGQGARPKELIADWSELLLNYVKGRSGLVDAYEIYDVLLNYWADTMQDDCYMISNDGWTYPEVRAVKTKIIIDKKTNQQKTKDSAILYDEIVCDLVPVNIVLAEYFTTETTEIADLSSQVEQKQASMDDLVEQNTEIFNFNDDEDTDEGKEISVKVADVKKAIKNEKTECATDEDVKVLQQWLILYNEKDALSKTLKEKQSKLTDAVVTKYAALTESEIKMLVVERKWLVSVINFCEALMKNVTRQIASDVTTLAERYEITLGATESQVKDLEQEVLQSLNEMISASDFSHLIKKKFKETEVGTIPEDWELVAISKLTQDMADGPFGSNLKTEHYTKDKQVRIIQLGNIGDCGWLNENTKYTTFEHAKTLARCIAVPGCILVAKMMPSGRAIICPDEEKQYILGSDVVRMIPNELLNATYFVYQSKSDIYLNQIAANTQGSTRQRTSISKLRNILIPLPQDKSEQIRIATTLSDIDAFISELDKLKEKYTAIKQAMMQQLLTGKIRLVETTAKTNATIANVHFRRSVLAAEIADRLCDEPTFGHVKMEKILFLTERLCHIDIGSHYHRDAAGPYDNNALRSIDSQLKKQKWFEVQHTEKGNRYVPMQNRGKHKTYFSKYYSDILPTFEKIINTFKTQRTEQCEIVATLYSAWEDLLHSNKPFTDADIVNEVLNNWHESKKRISQDRWLKAIQWMRENGFTPDNNNNLS